MAADTLRLLEANAAAFAAERDGSTLYDEEAVLPDPEPAEPACVTRIVLGPDTVLAATAALTAVGRVGVLNFASAKHPGGGFRKGANAQEESLARSTSLYPCLLRFERSFYAFNKRHANAGAYTHRLVFSPAVALLKDDAGRLQREPWRRADVLTCPAVNRSVSRMDDAEAERLMRERMRRVLAVAALRGCRVLVLGAFGCGVFRNDAGMVARLWHELLLTGPYRGVFDVVAFALFGPQENLDAFRAQFPDAAGLAAAVPK